MQNWLDTMTVRKDKREEWINDIEDKIKEHNEAEKKRESKVLDCKCRLKELSNSFKCNNICNIEIPEEEEERGGKKGTNGLFEEIIVENFPTLGKEIDL